jgi:hypothetical protein
MISRAFATETPRPTTPQLRISSPSSRPASASSASDSEDSTDYSLGSLSVYFPEEKIPNAKVVEALVIDAIKDGRPEHSLQPLLEERGIEICLTERIVRAAKEDEYGGENMVQMLIRHAISHQEAAAAGGKAVVEPKALLAAMELFDTGIGTLVVLGFWGTVAIPVPKLQMIVRSSAQALEIMEMLLRERSTASSSSSSTIHLSEGWMLAAVMNHKCGVELLGLLLRTQRHGDDTRITERVLAAAARNTGAGKGIFEMLFRERRDEIQAAPEVLLAACSNVEYVTDMLLDSSKGQTIRVTGSMVEKTKDQSSVYEDMILSMRGKQKMEKMMSKTMKKIISRSDPIDFTLPALSAFAMLEDTSLLEYLLSEAKLVNQFRIPPSMVEAAAANPTAGLKVMGLLLRKRGNEVHITERVLLAAVRNWQSGLDVVEFLFRERAGKVRVTERMLEAAVGAYRSEDMLKLLLSLAGNDICITTKMVEKAALKDLGGDKLLDMLLQAGRHDIQITKRLVSKACDRGFHDYIYRRNLKALLEKGRRLRVSKEAPMAFAWSSAQSSHMEIIALFLQKIGDDENVREAVLTAAVNTGVHLLAMVLEPRWESVKITKRVVLTTNRLDSRHDEKLEKVLEQLLLKYGDGVQFSEEALEAIMQHCGSNLVRLLLQKQGDKIRITYKMMEAAAKNRRNGHDVLQLLLREPGNEICITEDLMDAAMGNDWGRKGSIQILLLAEKGEEIQVTENMMEFAAREAQDLWLWLFRSDRNIQVTERVVEAAVSNRYCGDSSLKGLLRDYGANIQITERVLEAAARNPDKATSILEFLLRERGDDIYISERIMEAAVQNPESAVQVLDLLFKARPDETEITERVLEAAAGHLKKGDQIIDYLLCQYRRIYGEDIDISERVLEAASRNEEIGDRIINTIFRRLKGTFWITERVLEAVVRNNGRGREIVRFFLDRAGTEIQMTSKVLEADIENSCVIAPSLLEKGGDRIQLTERLVEASVRCNGWFMCSQINDIQLTERVIEFIARTRPSVFKDLLRERRDEIKFTQRVLEECAAGVEYNQGGVMEQLLQATKGKIRVTTRMVEAAAINEKTGEQTIKLLLEERGDEFKITGKIMRAAVKNKESGLQIVDLILRERRQSDNIQIDEGLMEAAAENEVDGENIIDLLLLESGDSIPLTDSIAEAAAENKRCGERIIELFRIRTKR